MGGLASVWHNKFLFNNKSSYTKLPLEIVVLIRRKIRDGLKSKEGKMSQETPNTVVPVPMLVNRYTEKGQSHKLNTKSQYRRKLLQHLNGEKKKEEVHCEHARSRFHPTGVTETEGKKRIMKL